jgi:ABC-2 type transport system ATP-binding protein
MSQLFSLYADLTVEENIQLFAGLYGVTDNRLRKRSDWVLEMSNLREHRRRMTGTLSLGFKQRLALGCAVLHEPPILFLDEPTSGVDPLARRAFWELIYQFAESGTTVFVSTHYMEEAEYCTRLALMNRGRVIALDRPAGFKSTMEESILQLETDNAPVAVEVLQAAPSVITAAMFGRAVHVMVREEAPAQQEITSALHAANLECRSLRRVSPSLEDVFVSLVMREGGVVAG